MSKLKEFTSTIKKRFDEAPEQVLIAGAVVLTAVGKTLDLYAGAKSKRAYARRMNHSIKNSR